MKKPVVPGDRRESPEYLRLSLAAAMVLGFKNGQFYRNAKLHCMNLLMTYDEGCHANCAYCGLQKARSGKFIKKSFIRVEWPIYSLNQIIEKINENRKEVKRICLSQITHPRVSEHTKILIEKIAALKIPISILLCPTIIKKQDLEYYRKKGVNMIGIALDLATPELFDKYRGNSVKGPHKWCNYENILKQAFTIFGRNRVGVHLIVGLGETEKEMVSLIQNLNDQEVLIHLFSFFPEDNSLLNNRPQAPASQFRRIQLARYLIIKGSSRYENMSFNKDRQITCFGVSEKLKQDIVSSGNPFLTSGCPYCSRPYGDCQPGDDIRSFPFPLDEKDISLVQSQLGIDVA